MLSKLNRKGFGPSRAPTGERRLRPYCCGDQSSARRPETHGPPRQPSRLRPEPQVRRETSRSSFCRCPARAPRQSGHTCWRPAAGILARARQWVFTPCQPAARSPRTGTRPEPGNGSATCFTPGKAGREKVRPRAGTSYLPWGSDTNG